MMPQSVKMFSDELRKELIGELKTTDALLLNSVDSMSHSACRDSLKLYVVEDVLCQLYIQKLERLIVEKDTIINQLSSIHSSAVCKDNISIPSPVSVSTQSNIRMCSISREELSRQLQRKLRRES